MPRIPNSHGFILYSIVMYSHYSVRVIVHPWKGPLATDMDCSCNGHCLIALGMAGPFGLETSRSGSAETQGHAMARRGQCSDDFQLGNHRPLFLLHLEVNIADCSIWWFIGDLMNALVSSFS